MFSSEQLWRKDQKHYEDYLRFTFSDFYAKLSHNRLQSALLFRVHEMFSMLVEPCGLEDAPG